MVEAPAARRWHHRDQAPLASTWWRSPTGASKLKRYRAYAASAIGRRYQDSTRPRAAPSIDRSNGAHGRTSRIQVPSQAIDGKSFLSSLADLKAHPQRDKFLTSFPA